MALKAAENTPAPVQQMGTVQVVGTTSVAVMPPPGRRLTANDVVGSTFAVDHYIKFTDMGTITLGDSKKQFEELRLVLNLGDIGFGHGIRYGKNPIIYARTTDGVTTDKGTAWAEEMDKGRRVDPRLQPFNSWQLPFILAEDVPEHKLGERLGYTTVWSSFNTFHPFYLKCIEQFGENAVVELKLTCKSVSKNGNTWGVPDFTLIGTVEQDGP
jgi:hypothetical protein